MKRLIFLFHAVVILLSGCGKTPPQSVPEKAAVTVPSERVVIDRPDPTPAPTPTPAPSFDPYEVDMIDTPDSSCFCEVGYSYEFEKLVVRFRDNSDRIYIYSDVTEDVWNEFIKSSSLGGYFNREIRLL